MKKVMIFYASYGGGHLSAAKAIKNFIDDHYKEVQTEMVDCVKYVNKTLDKLSTSAYKEMAKKAPWAWGKVYYNSQKGLLAKISSSSNKLMAKKLNKLLMEYKPNLIISTHPFASQMCSYLRKNHKLDAKIATIMTDFAPHDQWLVGSDYVDYFFVSNDKIKDSLIDLGIDSFKIFVTGIPLSARFLEEHNHKKILNDFYLSEDKKTILFFGGGEFGLGKNKTVQILRTLLENYSDIQVVAISGKNEKMKSAFQELSNELHAESKIKILEYTNQVPELMSISDLVITKPGGLTITESLASKLPIIIINPLPGQEEENAEFLENAGAAVWIKKDDNPKQIIDTILLNKDKLTQMRKNSEMLSRPYSTRDICKILLED